MKRSSSFTASRRSVLAASTVGALGAALVAVPLLAVSASATEDHGDGHKVTICHRNNNDKKPYVQETVDIASTGLLKSGHNGHTGDVWSAGMKSDHDKWGDIIPAYTYKISEHKTFSFPGLNWDAEGKAIYNAGCKVVLPTPTQTTPSTEPTDEPTTPEETATEEPGSPEPTATESTATEEPGSPEPTATETSPEPTSTEEPASPEPTATETSPEPTATETSPEPTSTEVPSPSQSTPSNGNGSPVPETSDPSGNSSENPGLPSTDGNSATLPKTGSDSGALLALAAGLVTVGAASIVVARRRTEAETD